MWTRGAGDGLQGAGLSASRRGGPASTLPPERRWSRPLVRPELVPGFHVRFNCSDASQRYTGSRTGYAREHRSHWGACSLVPGAAGCATEACARVLFWRPRV